MNLNATLFGQAISFFLFVLFCMKYVWPPLINIIEKRQKEIANALASVEEANKKVELAHIQASNQLKCARIEANSLIEQANQYRVQIINDAKSEAERERIKIIMQAKSEINAERKRVREELRKEIVSLSVACAEKIIERSIDAKTHVDIINQLITSL